MHAKEIRSSNSENVLPAKSCLVNSSRRHERGDEGIKILSQGQEQEHYGSHGDSRPRLLRILYSLPSTASTSDILESSHAFLDGDMASPLTTQYSPLHLRAC